MEEGVSGGGGLFLPTDVGQGLLIEKVLFVIEMTRYLYREGAIGTHLFEVGQGQVEQEEAHALGIAATMKLDRMFFQDVRWKGRKLLVEPRIDLPALRKRLAYRWQGLRLLVKACKYLVAGPWHGL